MERAKGLEPSTSSLGSLRSSQLSYARNCPTIRQAGVPIKQGPETKKEISTPDKKYHTSRRQPLTRHFPEPVKDGSGPERL